MPSYEDLNKAIESLENTSFRESLNEDALNDDFTSRGDSSNTPVSKKMIFQKQKPNPNTNNEHSQELPIQSSKFRPQEDSSKNLG
jgi:ABC-type tungstate transport system permease subunit